MTAPVHPDRSVSDPVGLIVDLVTAVEDQLSAERIRAVVTAVAGDGPAYVRGDPATALPMGLRGKTGKDHELGKALAV